MENKPMQVFNKNNPDSVHVPIDDFPESGLNVIYREGEAFIGYVKWGPWTKGHLTVEYSTFYQCKMIQPPRGGYGFGEWCKDAKIYFRAKTNQEHCLQIGAVL